MEEVNETALTELVDETVGIQESTFDYSDVTPEEESELKSFKLEKNVVDHAVIVIKGRHLKRAQEIYSKKGSGKFQKWVEEEYKMSFSMAHNYMRAYEVLENNNLLDETSNGWINEKIKKVGAHKLSYLAGLPETQQKEVLENAPLNEMNRKEVEQLTKKVKETGEYNEQLLNEVRQEKENAKRTAEQKDAEIKKLQEKVKELENVQPVAQAEPEIVEKVVEKVVEKEVIPDYIQQELEQKEKMIKDLSNKNGDLNDALISIKNQQKLTQERQFNDENKDWNDLCIRISTFIRDSAQFTFLKEDFKQLTKQQQEMIITNLSKIEEWLIKMKRITNQSLTLGNAIYAETNYQILKEE